MCGRFTHRRSWAELMEVLRGFLRGPFRVDDGAPEPRASYNVKPTQQVAMLIGGDEPLVTSARWWFVPHWFRDGVEAWKQTTFNARIETAAEKPAFRAAWAHGRCAIPCDGYYEWTGPKGAREPWFITARTNAPVLFFAGLASRLADGTRTCAILTRPALPEIVHLHDRMPVLLGEETLLPWLGGAIDTAAAKARLGTQWQGRMDFHRVAPIGRDSEGPALIAPLA